MADRRTAPEIVIALALACEIAVSAASIQAPKDAVIRVGTNATFSVFIGSSGSPAIQWFENGLLIPGATESTYTTPIQNTPRSASYDAVIHVDGVTQRSAPANLLVLPTHPENLLAHWTFDGLINGSTAPDSAGNFDGTIVNGAIVPGRVGRGALQIKGSNSFMRVTSPALRTYLAGNYLAGKPFSLLWWHRGDPPVSGLARILSLPLFQIYLASTGQTGGGIMVLEQRHEIWIPNYADSELYGNWRQYALVWDGSRCFFYEDGVLRRDWSLAGRGGVRADDGGPSLHLGSIGEYNDFRGAIDDVRIYDVALSTAQILSMGPPPGIEIRQQPRNYRIGSGDNVTLTAEAFPVATSAWAFYEWEMNGSSIPGNGNTVTITGSAMPGVAKVRAKITVGDLQAYTREALIETVSPAPPGLLLHYDFENDRGDSIRDASGTYDGQPLNIRHVRGRVGKYAAGFESSYIRVPAAGTSLELAGTPYTIAWWMKFERPLRSAPLTAFTPHPWTEVIFDLGPQTGGVGYGCDLIGNKINGLHKSISPPRLPAVFDVFNPKGWMHVAIIYDGETHRLYLNGKEVASAPTTQGIIGSGSHDLYLGNSTEAEGLLGGYGPYYRMAFGGLLDDFRIYSFALPAEQILELVHVAPQLAISAASNRIGIAWPESSEAVFTLEQSLSLGVEARWAPATPPPVKVNSEYQATLTPDGASHFFRLKKN